MPIQVHKVKPNFERDKLQTKFSWGKSCGCDSSFSAAGRGVNRTLGLKMFVKKEV